ncbi:MAG: diguanylate cyclase [Clostridia bacterium]|nr:diguanylate cyclase [Clostridia bacterium]
MIRDYMINACMLIAFLSVINQIFHNIGFHTKSPLWVRLAAGSIFGLLAIILMEFAIRLPYNTLVDFRYLAIILAALNVGWLGALTAGAMAILARTIIFGWTISSLVGIILVAVISGVAAYLSIPHWKKWLCAVPLSLAVICFNYAYQIHEAQLRFQLIYSYTVSFLLTALFMYFYNEYLRTINESYQKCKVESKKDFLTGLNNVRSFDTLYNKALEYAVIRQQPLALVYIDIDFFKRVNDTYGHKEGDTVLGHLGQILMESTRDMDYVSRNGGEEFSAILIDCPKELALEIAERIRKTVESSPIKLSDGKMIHITISLGIAVFPDPISDYKVLREKADGALYEAKRSGRNRSILAS